MDRPDGLRDGWNLAVALRALLPEGECPWGTAASDAWAVVRRDAKVDARPEGRLRLVGGAEKSVDPALVVRAQAVEFRPKR